MRAHPWHPAIVHFPIACWSLAALIDAAALVGALPERAATWVQGLEPSALSFALLWAGLGLGLFAMIVGFADFLRLPPRLQRSGAVSWHIAAMTSAWALFLAAALLRPEPSTPFPPAPLAATLVEIAGFVCLVGGGVLAAAVVFDGWPRPAASEE
jgi:uncharacterized membrane protein